MPLIYWNLIDYRKEKTEKINSLGDELKKKILILKIDSVTKDTSCTVEKFMRLVKCSSVV